MKIKASMENCSIVQCFWSRWKSKQSNISENCSIIKFACLGVSFYFRYFYKGAMMRIYIFDFEKQFFNETQNGGKTFHKHKCFEIAVFQNYRTFHLWTYYCSLFRRERTILLRTFKK